MSLFVWDDKHSIGIAEIDQQHKCILNQCHDLHNAMRSGRSASHVEPALIELAEICELHFKTEETLMAFHRFPQIEEHRHEHRLISAELARFLAEQKSGRAGVVVDLLEYLEDLQGIHILQHDIKYRDYLMQQWGINFKNEGALPPRPLRGKEDERRYARLACSLPVELHFSTEPPIVYGHCVNISRTGAFLKSWSAVRVNTTATASFQVGSTRADVRVCVRRSEPCIGMGVSFLGPVPPKLHDYIQNLEQRQPDSRATEATCERIMHACVQNLTALEDVISEAGLTERTATVLGSLLNHLHGLERLAKTSAQTETIR